MSEHLTTPSRILRFAPSNGVAALVGAALMIVALVLSNVTLASGDYGGALAGALACTAAGLLVLAVPARRGPRVWRIASLILALPAAFVVSDFLRRAPYLGSPRRPGATVKPDTRPAFALDPSKPFVVELGRGSGRSGLYVVRFDESGAAELHQYSNGPGAQEVSLRLPPADVKALTDLANQERLTGMGRSYSTGVMDGTQWVLWIQQGASEKSVYFDNSFPAPIGRFADALDAAVTRAGLGTAAWRAVPRQVEEGRQRALWKRIE